MWRRLLLSFHIYMLCFFFNEDLFHQITIRCFTQFEATAEPGFSLHYIRQTNITLKC